MGKVDTDFGHDGVNIVYNNGKWDYKNASDLRYWPTEALDFYAFNPGTVDEAMQWSYMWVVGVALVSAALLNTLKPIAFCEEVSTFVISSSEQPMSSAPKIAQSITVLFFINKNKLN